MRQEGCGRATADGRHLPDLPARHGRGVGPRRESRRHGGAAALGPALQSVGVTSGYYLFNAAPYILTLAIMIITCSPKRTLTGAPAELSITR